MEIFQEFGVQPVLLAGQIVNFLILLFILKKLFYKPILKHLAERRRRIKQGLKKAEEADKILEEAKKKYAEKLADAGQKAEMLLQETEKEAEKIILRARAKAKEEAKDILTSAREKLKKERQIMIKEIKEEMAEIVSVALGRILEGMFKPEKKQKHYIAKTLQEIYEEKRN